MRTVRLVLLVLASSPLLLRAQTPARSATIDPASYAKLHWRTIGPEGNRFTSAAGIPGDPLTY
ncbi:MAG: hypothetical protein ABIT38_24270 [Gemmatimonadaceae bacterium]